MPPFLQGKKGEECYNLRVMQDAITVLEFCRIEEALSGYARTELGKSGCLSLHILSPEELESE